MQWQKSPSLIIKEPRVLKPGKQATLDSTPVFVCSEPGCIKTFARFADFELDLDVGEHVVQNEPADLEHNIYDKLKRDCCYVCNSANLRTSTAALPTMYSQRRICSRSKHGLGPGQG